MNKSSGNTRAAPEGPDKPAEQAQHQSTVRARKPGKIEAAILREIRDVGGSSGMIDDHGPRTGQAIDRLEAKGWLRNMGDVWFLTDAGREALAT